MSGVSCIGLQTPIQFQIVYPEVYHTYTNEKSPSKPPGSEGNTYSVIHIVIPRFLISHGPFAVPDPGRSRIHNHPDQAQEGQRLVHQLQHQALRDLREHINSAGML